MNDYNQICTGLEELGQNTSDNVERLRRIAATMWLNETGGQIRPEASDEMRVWLRELRDEALKRDIIRQGELFRS